MLSARLHFGHPASAYLISAILAIAGGLGRLELMRSGDVRGPFIFFYPAIAVAAFLGGAGPGLFSMALCAVFAMAFFPAFPPLPNWLTLGVLGPLVAAGFSHMRSIRERSVALSREVARFRFISEHVSDWIFLTGEAGVIEYANQTACNALNRTAGELTGRALADFVPEWQRDRLRELLQRSCDGAAAPQEIVFERPGREPMIVEISCSAVRTGSAVVIHLAGRDITERKQLDLRVREARQWESLKVMAGGLAHDFNNLLTAIIGNATLARHTLAPEHPVSSLLAGIESAGDRSSELVRMMLSIAAYRPANEEPMRLDLLLEALLERRTLPAGVRVTVDAAPAEFTADRASFETLLWSLISNAVESYGDAAGEVKVTLREGPLPELTGGRFEEGAGPEGSCIGIAVEDHGCGMADQTLERAFDPFFTTKFMGRGLGLPAVRGIVRAYSGKLWVRTLAGSGTRIEVWLPRPDSVT